MAGEDGYFGYTTAGNAQLLKNRQLARRMGEDITYYPAPTSGEYVDPTINWNDPKFSDADQERSNELFANDSIEKIHQRVMAQNAGAVRQLGDQWYRVTQVIQDISDRVLKSARGLKYGGDGSPGNKGGWTGQGADSFLARGPGATLKSLDDWRSAAVTNWIGTLSLADAITTHQVRMSALYAEYKQSMVTFGKEWQERNLGDVPVADAGSNAQDKYVTALRTEQIAWSKRAQAIQYDMARAYWSIMSEDLNGGRATVYEGPGDAVQPSPEFLARYMRSQFPSIGTPRVGTPNIGTPNVTTPNVVTPNVVAPKVTTPRAIAELVERPVQVPEAPETVTPNVNVPAVPTPQLTAPVLPTPPLTMPGGGRTPSGLPGVPGTGQAGLKSGPGPALARGANSLLGNAQSQGVPGVLRGGGAPTVPGEPGLPPAPPQSPRGAPGGPQIGGRGPGRNITAGPPGTQAGSPGTSLPPNAPSNPRAGAHGPDRSGVDRPAAPPTGARTSQFGAPPAAPNSPVLRGPRSGPATPPTGTPSRRGPLASDATPPVLNRPRPTTASTEYQPTPPATSSPRADSLAPPTPPTTRPVVGRSASTAPGTPRPADPASGVLRGARRSVGYQAEIGSRKKGRDDQAARVDQDFDQIRRLLDREEAWTVATPGGGVLDSAPTRSRAVVAEPKPTVGGGA